MPALAEAGYYSTVTQGGFTVATSGYIRINPNQIEPFAGQRLVDHVAKRIGAEAGGRAQLTLARPVLLRARGDKTLRRANPMKMFATICNF